MMRLVCDERLLGTYHARDFDDRRVDAQDLVNNSVEIGKTTGKLIVSRICTMVEKLVSQFRLHVRVP